RVVARQRRAEVGQLGPDLVGELLAHDELDALEDALSLRDRGSGLEAGVVGSRVTRVVAAAVQAGRAGIVDTGGARVHESAGRSRRVRRVVEVATIFDRPAERAVRALDADRK